ncbi:MAG: hypothetical protein GX423_03130 [Nitrospiraceae bacterium]|jgi:hypothetical protein|nr:hypothetical protein [Nitrospiraceae bacterium]
MGLYSGGTAVARGVYWNPVDGQEVHILTHGVLPGDASRRYLKMTAAGLLVVAPVFGLIFLLFLPLFGIGMIGILCVVPMVSGLASVTMTAVRLASGLAGTGWRASRSHLDGKGRRPVSRKKMD